AACLAMSQGLLGHVDGSSMGRRLIGTFGIVVLACSLLSAGPAVAAVGGHAPVPLWIAFSRTDATGTHIYKVWYDGTQLTQLTDRKAADSQPAFSPDGTRILFTRTTGPTSDLSHGGRRVVTASASPASGRSVVAGLVGLTALFRERPRWHQRSLERLRRRDICGSGSQDAVR